MNGADPRTHKKLLYKLIIKLTEFEESEEQDPKKPRQ